jgi:hypothetical protein
MFTLILEAIVKFGPPIVAGVEALFSHKAKSGTQKLSLTVDLVLEGLEAAEVIDSKDIGQPEIDLATGISNAIVKYNNDRGIFSHSLPAAPAPAAPAVLAAHVAPQLIPPTS